MFLRTEFVLLHLVLAGCQGVASSVYSENTSLCFSKLNSTTGQCQRPLADQCSVPGEERYDCGFPGVGRDGCLTRGCCHDSSVPNVPWCFFSEISPCTIPLVSRLDCGDINTTEDSCINSGCCWEDSGQPQYPYCFYKTTSPSHTFKTKDPGYPVFLHTHRRVFSFNLQTCTHARVYMQTSIVDTGNSYRFFLGEGSTSQLEFKKFVNNNEDHSEAFSVDGLVECGQMKPFYITWENGKIAMGRSHNDAWVSWIDELPLDINVISLFSTNNEEAVWQFSNTAGGSLTVTLSGTSPVQFDRDLSIEVRPQTTDLVFSVQACKHAYLSLSSNRGIQNENAYEIVIGAENNMKTTLRQRMRDQTQPIREILSERILSCNMQLFFWVTWGQGHVELGKGRKVGTDRIIDDMFDAILPVRFVSMALDESPSVTSVWDFGALSEEIYIVKTLPTHSDDIRVNLHTHKSNFVFELQSCKNAHIYLAADQADYMYEIEIGQNEDHTRIRSYPNGAWRTRPTPGVLSCYESRSFWLSWHDGYVAVGRGPLVGQNELVTFYESAVNTIISGIALRTSSTSHGGEWKFQKQVVESVVMYPERGRTYHSLWRSVFESTYVYVRVRACSDVYIALTKYIGSFASRSYEVALGINGNTVSRITTELEGALATKSGPILDCNKALYFWLDWGTNGYLVVGTGTVVGQDEFMSARLSTLRDISAIGMAYDYEYGTSNPPLFEISTPTGDAYTIFTYANRLKNRATFITRQQYFIFRVRMRNNAKVILHPNPDEPISNNIEVHLGETSNNRVSIFKQGIQVASSPLNNVVSFDEMREFWIKFGDKTVAVGAGNTVGYSEIVTYTDTYAIAHIHAVTLTSDTEDGQWQCNTAGVIGARIMTNNQYDYNNFWVNVQDKNSLVFRVAASNDAHIIVSSVTATPGLHDEREVVIGASGNSRVVIRNKRLNQDLVSATTPDILSADNPQYFWISWYNNIYEVGRGHKVGADTLVKLQEPTMWTPSIAAVSTGWGAEGVWYFDNDEDDFFNVRTIGPYSYQYFKYYPLTQSFRFKAQACGGAASIALYKDESRNLAYHIFIGDKNNSLTYILKGDDTNYQSDQSVSTADPLSCYYARGFKLDWGMSGISLIADDASLVLHWRDPDYTPPLFVSLAGKGYTNVEWFYTRTQGDSTRLTTYSDDLKHIEHPEYPIQPLDDLEDKYSQLWMAVHDKNYFAFKVRACSDADILLSEYFGVPEYGSYEVRIGTDEGKSAGIYTGATTMCMEKTFTDPLLHCLEYRAFWIRWEKGLIQVGQGMNFGEQRLVWCQTQGHMVTGVAFASDRAENAHWVFEDVSGNIYKFWSLKSIDAIPVFDRTWVVPRQQWITFDVQASQWAVVAINSQPWRSSSDSYEVHLGVTENNRRLFYIVDSADPERKLVQTEGNYLKSDRLTSFWISWDSKDDDGKLYVGLGHHKNAGPTIMSTPSTLPFDAYGIGFATPLQDSVWQIPRDLIRQYDTRMREDSLETSRFHLSVGDLLSVVFQVLSRPAEAVIVLTHYPERIDLSAYKITIGADNNRKTTIQYEENSEILASADTKNVLHEHQRRTFWISWRNGLIRVGEYGLVGSYVLLEYQDPNVLSFYGLTMFGGVDSYTHWEFTEIVDNTYNILTTPQFGYNTFWMSLNNVHASFRVRACNDAHITLSKERFNTDNTSSYEVVLGASGNTNLFLRKGTLSYPVAWSGISDLVNCFELRRFWMSWRDGVFRIGSGGADSNEYLAYEDPNPIQDLQYLSVSTGWNSFGEWEIKHSEGEHISLYPPADISYNYEQLYVTVQGYNFIDFRVKACHGAFLALSEVPSVIAYDTFEIMIGVEGPRGVAFREAVGGENKMTAAMDQELLSCDEARMFWVQWSRRNPIQFGTGYKYNGPKSDKRLFSYQPDRQFYIKGISFKTGDGNPGEFFVRDPLIIYEGVNSGGMSGGQVFGVIIGVLIGVALIGFIVAMVMLPSFREKTTTTWNSINWQALNPFRKSTPEPSMAFDNKNYEVSSNA